MGKATAKAGGKDNTKGTGKGKNSTVFTGPCWNCGIVGHSMKNCPALNKGFPYKCHNCGLVGHKATQCPNKINEVEDSNKEGAKEPEQETFAVSWGGGVNAVQKIGNPGHAYDGQGFKTVKC